MLNNPVIFSEKPRAIVKLIELKNKLLRLNIFQIEKDYPSISIDGTRWRLSVRFNGKKICSKGYNNYPAR